MSKQIYKRTIQTFVLRTGRMTDSQKRDYEQHSSLWCIPFQDSVISLLDIFPESQPTTIEIGFGMGHATALLAASNPDKNYLGIEVHRPGVGRLLGEIDQKGLQNLKIIEYDALVVLEKMIPDVSVEAFHIFFPDPWPKKKHHKRRLMQASHIELIAQKLKPDGYIYMVTDWEPYAQSALEELQKVRSIYSPYVSFAPAQEWRPQTKFERKGVQANRDIKELFFVKKGT